MPSLAVARRERRENDRIAVWLQKYSKINFSSRNGECGASSLALFLPVAPALLL